VTGCKCRLSTELDGALLAVLEFDDLSDFEVGVRRGSHVDLSQQACGWFWWKDLGVVRIRRRKRSSSSRQTEAERGGGESRSWMADVMKE
jgi:hypothetical protein